MEIPLVQVFEALTKRTRSDTVASKLTRVKDSALARRIWVDKVLARSSFLTLGLGFGTASSRGEHNAMTYATGNLLYH